MAGKVLGESPARPLHAQGASWGWDAAKAHPKGPLPSKPPHQVTSSPPARPGAALPKHHVLLQSQEQVPKIPLAAWPRAQEGASPCLLLISTAAVSWDCWSDCFLLLFPSRSALPLIYLRMLAAPRALLIKIKKKQNPKTNKLIFKKGGVGRGLVISLLTLGFARSGKTKWQNSTKIHGQVALGCLCPLPSPCPSVPSVPIPPTRRLLLTQQQHPPGPSIIPD